MTKLVADSTVCWIGDEGEWNVGTTFKDVFKQLTCFHKGGLVPCLLVRHKHTCELEYVPTHLLSDYPMEPIPEPGVVDATMERFKQEFMCNPPVARKEGELKHGDLVQIRPGFRWADETYMKYVGQVAAVVRPS